MYGPCFSPDGKKIAAYWGRLADNEKIVYGLWVISLQDSCQTLISNGAYLPIKWSNDGNWIYAYYYLTDKLLLFSADGGSSKTHFELPFENATYGGDITPNGSYGVAAVEESTSDIWLMENFDPEVK